MSKAIVFSNLGFILGIAGVILAVIPFFNMNNPQIYNIVLPIIFGIVGLVLAFKIKKELNDDVAKAGFVVNPLAIVLGIIQLIIYLIK